MSSASFMIARIKFQDFFKIFEAFVELVGFFVESSSSGRSLELVTKLRR